MRNTQSSASARWMVLVGIVTCALLCLASCDPEPEEDHGTRVISIFWAHDHKIQRTEVYEYSDGWVALHNDPATVIVEDADADFRDVQVDPTNEKLYWTQKDTTTGDYQVWRAELDGTNPELLVDPLVRAEQLVLDLEEGKVYWCGFDDVVNDGLIQRANLDGSAPELDFIVTGDLYPPTDLALKLDDPKTLYWAVWDGTDARYEIRKAELDPLGPQQDVIAGSYVPVAMVYYDGFLYWADSNWDRIFKLPYGGGTADIKDVLTGTPDEIALDTTGGKVYWGNDTQIRRANLDGSAQEYVFNQPGDFGVEGMALLR